MDEGGEGTTGLESFLREDRVRGFDLSTAPAWRVALLETAFVVWQMIWSFHHLLLDGRSHTRVFEEWRTVYRALGTGEWPCLPPAPAYRDFWIT